MKKQDTRFKPGQSGNPRGRPKGVRNQATVMAEALIQAEGEAVVRAILDEAKSGNMSAARLVVERLIPPARERRITLALPSMRDAKGIAGAQAAVIEALACGEITPGEATTLSAVIEAQRKALETQELEARITALESKDA